MTLPPLKRMFSIAATLILAASTHPQTPASRRTLLPGTIEPSAEKLDLTPGEHYATLADVRLHYTVAGEGPLLFVCSPRWGVGSLYLQRGLVPLEKNYRLLFVDTRGSGKSSRPADPAKMSGADMADDLDHLRIYLGLGKIRLLGHSDGASIALDFAERYPTKISDLLFVDGETLGKGAPIQEERAQHDEMIKQLSGDPRYQRALAARTEPSPTNDVQMMQYMKDTMPLYFADLRNMQILGKDAEGAIPSSWALNEHVKADSAHTWRQEEDLAEVRARTLVIVGKQDRICPSLIAEHVHQGIHNSQLVEIDGSGHFPWIEQPTQFFKAVNNFLQGH